MRIRMLVHMDTSEETGPTAALFNRVPPERLDPDQRAVYDAILASRSGGARDPMVIGEDGALEGPFGAMVAAPAVGMELQALGAAIRFRGTLSDLVRELAILALAGAERCDFEWIVHERLARAAGATDGDIAFAQSGGEAPASLSDADARAVAAARELATAAPAPATSLAAIIGDGAVPTAVELITLIGYYRTLAVLLRELAIPVPAAARRR
jgi:4-carboxymuconolactone decarboxylase